MKVVAAVAALLGSGDTLVLREEARVAGRYVRLADLLDADRSSESVRLLAAEVYLGRAPADEERRTITVDEIRRELERRGVDAAALSFVGERVEVFRGEGSAAAESLRRSIAMEITRQALERRPGSRSGDVRVRIACIKPESCPEGYKVAEVRPGGGADGHFAAVLRNAADAKTLEVEVIARILETREVAFAARDIAAGKVVERLDLEIKRLETSGEENYAGDFASVIGSTAAVRVRRGAPLLTSDLRLKAVVRRGDVVRAVSPTFEVDARALEDGAPGQEVALEFLSTRNRFRAKVAGASRVDVIEGRK